MAQPRYVAVRVPRGLADTAHWALAEQSASGAADYAIIEYHASLRAVEDAIRERHRQARVEATTQWRQRQRAGSEY